MDIRSLSTRTLSGIVYVGIIIACIFCREWGVFSLASLFAILGSLEFHKICKDNLSGNRCTVTVIDCLATLSLVWGIEFWTLLILILLLILRMAVELWSKSERPLVSVALSFFSILYLGIPLGIMCLEPRDTGTTMPLLAIFFMIWLNDTGAYLVGSICGKHKLFERISPKKTWEGFFGGVLFCVISAIAFYYIKGFFKMNMSIEAYIILGLIVAILSTLGDLFESLYKRSHHIKDSGNLIPGHGGILDRIDSLLFVMPVAVVYILFMCSF